MTANTIATTAEREIRALFDAHSITVYQAFGEDIAREAISAQRFTPPFSLARATWIKPSFLWLMHRSDWGTAAGQERILAVRISREGFDWALEHSCMTTFDSHVYSTDSEWRDCLARHPVRIQWDPGRSITLRPERPRAIQVGLKGHAVRLYVNEWTEAIDDVTETAHRVAGLVRADRLPEARAILPSEQVYPLSTSARRAIGASHH